MMKIAFMILGILSIGSCLTRNAYNCSLYCFSYLLWDYVPSQKSRIFIIFIMTLFADLIYIITAAVNNSK